MKTKKWTVVLLLLLCIVLSSCGQSEPPKEVSGENEAPPPVEENNAPKTEDKFAAMDELLGPKEDITRLSSFELDSVSGKGVHVYANDAEREALLEIIYGFDTSGFTYASPKLPDSSNVVISGTPNDAAIYSRAGLLLEAKGVSYRFDVITQGSTVYLRCYEYTPFNPENPVVIDPPYILCPVGTVDVELIERLVSEMENNTTDSQYCAVLTRLSDQVSKTLAKGATAQAEFYLNAAFEKETFPEKNSSGSYDFEFALKDMRYCVSLESGECLRECNGETLYSKVEPRNLLRLRMSLTPAFD